MKNNDINNTINSLKNNNKSKIEFIIFLFAIIVILYILFYFININIDIKKYILILLIIVEITFLIFNILVMKNNNKLKKLINDKKNYFKNIIETKEDNINISNLIYNKDKSLKQEDIDRIDIFSKEERKIYSNNLIEGKYKDIYFKSYNIEIIDNNNKTYSGKWIELNTLIKDNISIYISKKEAYIKDLIYPKNIFEEIKDKNNRIFIKNKPKMLNHLIELQESINENIYISIINDRFQLLIFKDIKNLSIDRDIKRIFNYLETVYTYKSELLLCDTINTGD